MSQSPERCRNHSPRNHNDTRPSPSSRHILTGMICFCVPMLLLTSWQSTHRWTLSSIMMEDSAVNATTTSTARIWSNTVRQTEWQQEMNRFHFCGKSRVTAHSNGNKSESLTLLYQCSGPQYDDFASSLRTLTYRKSQESSSNRLDERLDDRCTATSSKSVPTHALWGRRDYPLPDNATVLVLGNSHLRQISKTLACQYANELSSIRFLPTLVTPTSVGNDGFVLEFDNGSRWISITNTVLVYSPQWKELLEDYFLSPMSLRMQDMDAMVLGKFTTYEEAQTTNFERTMAAEQEAYELTLRLQASTTSPEVDFSSIPPPDLADVAKVYDGPLVSVSMFSKSDSSRFLESYRNYQDECRKQHLDFSVTTRVNEKNIHLVDGRRYIDELQMECGTDDKNVLGTCHESSNSTQQKRRNLGATMMRRGRDASDMHRCAGEGGGHADLVAWDVVEGLYAKIEERNTAGTE